uniref:Uncharacterized protein n=1 Tax=Takifugu rubripes TaxID=31033 RepID=A0A3B5KMG2_TAKRU
SASIERGDHQGGSYQATREGARVMPSGSVGVEISAGVICAVLLLLISIMAVLLWLMSRQKGSYDTNEMDDDAEGADEESDGSDPALQMKEPLTIREEE